MVDCGCETAMNEFWDEREQTARKPHECGECHVGIPVGARYAYLVGKDYGEDLWSFAMCLACRELWREFEAALEDNLSRDYCRCLGQLRELVVEAFSDDRIRCYPVLAKLVAKGWLDPEDVCPGAEWLVPFRDERQLKLALT
mgnify:CR=1 FL=1